MTTAQPNGFGPKRVRAQWASSAAATRRPLQTWELPLLAGLGQRLAEYRCAAGLSIAELADGAEMSPGHLRRLERGERRTRASTLARLARALDPDRADELAVALVALAGAALAAESPYADRIARRRARRHRRRRSADSAAGTSPSPADARSQAVALIAALDRLDPNDTAGLAELERQADALVASRGAVARNVAGSGRGTRRGRMRP